MEIAARHGHVVEEFTRSSDNLPHNLKGRLIAGTSAFYAPESVRSFSALLDSFRPDVVHAYDLFPLISPGILAECTRRGIPVIMSCVHYRLTCPVATHFHEGKVCTRCLGGREHQAILHNCRANLAESVTVAFYNRFTRKRRSFLDHVTRFIAPSEFTRQWLIENGDVPADRIMVVTPGVDIPSKVSDPAVGTYVGFAGRFTPEKGIGVLLEAAKHCPVPIRLSRNAKFLPLPVPPGVEVVVTHNRDELHAFYGAARLLVAPSTWFETFGMVPAESMAHGIPVIASRLGAYGDLIEDGKDGVLFEPGDPKDLAAKIKHCWENPDFCRRLGRAARQKVVNWSFEHFYQSLNNLYEEVTESPTDSQRSYLARA